MRRGTTFAVVAGGAAAAAAGYLAWFRSREGAPPRPVVGVFANRMAFIRWGTGTKKLLWIVGGPGLGFPIGLRVALLPWMLRPFAQAGYTCWLVNRKEDMPAGYTLAEMAEDYAALIDQEFAGRVDLALGEDFGGWIGFHLAARHPERVAFLVNASTGYAITETGKAIDRNFADLVRDGRPAEAWDRMLSTLAPGLPAILTRILGEILDRLFTDRSRPDFVSNLIVETEAEQTCDVRGILPDVHIPVLLIGGDQGPFLSREILEETARLIPDCTLQLNPGKTDMAAISTKQLAADVLAWIATRRPARGEEALDPQARRRSIHIDAPVEQVFDHVKDPTNFVAADPEPVELTHLSITPEGVGSTWQTSWRAFGRPLRGVWTRQEYLPNERIVDHVSTGATWTFITTPDSTGTTLTLAFTFTTKWPFANTVINWLLPTQDQQFDRMLANYRQALQGAGNPPATPDRCSLHLHRRSQGE